MFASLSKGEEQDCLLLFTGDFAEEQINFFFVSSQDFLTEVYFTIEDLGL